MAEYEQSIVIDAPADEVFSFVANLNNLPKYVPALRNAQAAGQDRVTVQGSSMGYETGGYFRVDPAEYFMEWSAETDRNYAGWLEIEDLDDGCEITVHLSMSTNADTVDRGGGFDDVEADLRTALESIKGYCETGQTAMR